VQHRAAGITKNMFDVFTSQRFKQYSRATHLHKAYLDPLSFAAATIKHRRDKFAIQKLKTPANSLNSPGFGIFALTLRFRLSNRRAAPE
jgi:hypothetical protein